MKPEIIIIALLVIWNLTVFFVYGLDKWKSRHKKWRISEKSLITMAVVMGGIGAFMGMWVLRHKTKHVKFKILIPVALIFNISVVFMWMYFFER